MNDITKPQYEHGFWWWYDPTRRGWFIGCAPSFGRPSWAFQEQHHDRPHQHAARHAELDA